MNSENKYIIKAAFTIASKTNSSAVFIHADPLDDLIYDEKFLKKKIKLFFISKKKKLESPENDLFLSEAKATITVPKISLTRLSLIKVVTTLAMSQELIEPGEKIVFAVGQAENNKLDLIQIVDTSKESEIIIGKNFSKISHAANPEVFQAVLNLAIELADKGREGKPVGTIFVIGDHEKVLQFSKQMIMNPFKGYDEEDRHVLSNQLKDTIREFSALDGAFIISDDGTLLTAGRYLGAAIDDSNLPRGLGSRHQAAAGITSLTNAVAIAISESSGDVRIFKGGKVVMHIEKAPSKK